MTIGTVIAFSGTSSGNNNVNLVLFGPGYYANGVTIAQPKLNSIGSWNYTWNPGYRIISGTYTMVVYDAQNTTWAKTGFTVFGTQPISIVESRTIVNSGDSITFSGECQTGSTNVILTLYGQGQYTNGVVISTPSVNADQTWSYTWIVVAQASQTGTYTMTVQDAQKTQSVSVQFMVNS
jgi:hypothetical protein